MKNNNLKLISKNLIFSNSGEAIIIKKNFTKGVVLRGYKNNDFPKLEIFKENDFVGDISNLSQNFISVGSELSYDLNVKVGDKIMMMSSSGVETIIGSLPKQQTFIVSSIFKSGLVGDSTQIIFVFSFKLALRLSGSLKFANENSIPADLLRTFSNNR